MDQVEKSPLYSLSMNTDQDQKEAADKLDRFIPKKLCANLYNLYFADESKDKAKKENLDCNQVEMQDRANSRYNDLLKSHLLGSDGVVSSESVRKKAQPKFIKFATDTKGTKLDLLLSNEKDISPKLTLDSKIQRNISKAPYKVLDAPGLSDDYYLNLMDWSSNNLIGIGLENYVYFWSSTNSRVTKLCHYEEDNVCSVSWADSGRHIGIGNTSGILDVYDASKLAKVRSFEGHTGRISSLDWNGNIIASGSRDRSILLRDMRESRDFFCQLQGPAQEVCGLKWSFNENMLASGGNDNKLFLWSLKMQKEMTRFHEHTAAVKAIGWSPHDHNLLASGGGTADRCLRFWNTNTLEMVNCVDTGSQVCNLMFSKNSHELVSTHGYSLNQIIVWDFPTMEKLQTLTGHSLRVLYLAMSPNGQNIVTGAGDETLRFWNVFPPAKTKKQQFEQLR